MMALVLSSRYQSLDNVREYENDPLTSFEDMDAEHVLPAHPTFNIAV